MPAPETVAAQTSPVPASGPAVTHESRVSDYLNKGRTSLLHFQQRAVVISTLAHYLKSVDANLASYLSHDGLSSQSKENLLKTTSSLNVKFTDSLSAVVESEINQYLSKWYITEFIPHHYANFKAELIQQAEQEINLNLEKDVYVSKLSTLFNKKIKDILEGKIQEFDEKLPILLNTQVVPRFISQYLNESVVNEYIDNLIVDVTAAAYEDFIYYYVGIDSEIEDHLRSEAKEYIKGYLKTLCAKTAFSSESLVSYEEVKLSLQRMMDLFSEKEGAKCKSFLLEKMASKMIATVIAKRDGSVSLNKNIVNEMVRKYENRNNFNVKDFAQPYLMGVDERTCKDITQRLSAEFEKEFSLALTEIITAKHRECVETNKDLTEDELSELVLQLSNSFPSDDLKKKLIDNEKDNIKKGRKIEVKNTITDFFHEKEVKSNRDAAVRRYFFLVRDLENGSVIEQELFDALDAKVINDAVKNTFSVADQFVNGDLPWSESAVDERIQKSCDYFSKSIISRGWLVYTAKALLIEKFAAKHIEALFVKGSTVEEPSYLMPYLCILSKEEKTKALHLLKSKSKEIFKKHLLNETYSVFQNHFSYSLPITDARLNEIFSVHDKLWVSPPQEVKAAVFQVLKNTPVYKARVKELNHSLLILKQTCAKLNFPAFAYVDDLLNTDVNINGVDVLDPKRGFKEAVKKETYRSILVNAEKLAACSINGVESLKISFNETVNNAFVDQLINEIDKTFAEYNEPALEQKCAALTAVRCKLAGSKKMKFDQRFQVLGAYLNTNEGKNIVTVLQQEETWISKVLSFFGFRSKNAVVKSLLETCRTYTSTLNNTSSILPMDEVPAGMPLPSSTPVGHGRGVYVERPAPSPSASMTLPLTLS